MKKTASEWLTRAQLRMLRSLALTGHTDGAMGTVTALERRGLVLLRQWEGAPRGCMETVITAAGLSAVADLEVR